MSPKRTDLSAHERSKERVFHQPLMHLSNKKKRKERERSQKKKVPPRPLWKGGKRRRVGDNSVVLGARLQRGAAMGNERENNDFGATPSVGEEECATS